MQNNAFDIVVMAGDGVGVEVMDVACRVLEAAQKKTGGFTLAFDPYAVGAVAYRETGVALPQAAEQASERCDAVLLGAMGLPDIRLPDGRELAPQLDLREKFELFAGVRPIRQYAGVPKALAHPRADDIDFVILREQTEGLFARRGEGIVTDDQEAQDALIITRRASERLFEFAFELAHQRAHKGGTRSVTCVDKSNVLRSMGFFRKIFLEVAERHPDIEARCMYIDAMALDMLRQPWNLDVVVTTNLFGDILSDLGGGLIGGMGMAPSADIGPTAAVFQPAHGSAPDIAGQGIVNPVAMLLSAAMMLDWLGVHKQVESSRQAARLIEQAVERTLGEDALRTRDIGGSASTRDFEAGVLNNLARL